VPITAVLQGLSTAAPQAHIPSAGKMTGQENEEVGSPSKVYNASSSFSDEQERGAVMRCPRDGTELSAVEIAGVELDKCHTCDGLWLDASELPQLRAAQLTSIDAAIELEQGDPHSETRGVRQYMRCPRCGEPLRRVAAISAQSVEVDRCSGCRGLWLDAGEADQLATRRGSELPPRDDGGKRQLLRPEGRIALLMSTVRQWIRSDSSE
jgi:Zn-finger nucleic acid-binding protein